MMPLPLLLIPIATATATCFSSGTLIASIFGGIFTGITMGIRAFQLFQPPNVTRTHPEHSNESSRQRQAAALRRRVGDVERTIASVPPALATLAQSVALASSTTSTAAGEVKQSAQRVDAVSAQIPRSLTLVKDATDSLSSTALVIKDDTHELIVQLQKAIEDLGRLNGDLKTKEVELEKVSADICGLKETIDAHSRSTIKFEEMIQTLIKERRTLTDKIISLEGQIDVLQKKISSLEDLTRRQSHQLVFFKKAVLDSHPVEIVSQKLTPAL